MSEWDLVKNCAPTLAGIKTGSLFTCPYESRDAVLASVRRFNERLGSKGLRALPMRFSEKKALIYVFRPGKLMKDLESEAASELLRCRGYCVGSCGKCVGDLARNLRDGEEFPHEIGLFLGYPPEDVRGFLECGPDGCKCAGCWKVYGDEDTARKKFAQYKKCTKVYCDRYDQGVPIERLTVSS